MTLAVDAERLEKRFSSFVAVEDVSLRVEAGEIFGFIGPNGAGKTTTLRMLLGLVAPTRGSVSLFGHDVARDFKAAIANVGALVEGAAFHPFLSGRDNLRAFGCLTGGAPRARVDEVLDAVGLLARADDRVKGYSQGMRQRLGIALALLEAPRLLVLDEPTNGLDPQGTREVRDLVRRVRSERGTTVLLSSHLLAEMEQICDRVAVIAGGRILREGTLEEIVGRDAERVEIGVADGREEDAARVARARSATDVSVLRRGRIEFARGALDLAALNRALLDAGIDV
ncbi:MAG: ABC transporter ATP-binding protein, partial [Myxococcales bacterium]|nr:ABC transporter ATP-binding protein [Myxococcales bacterium]